MCAGSEQPTKHQQSILGDRESFDEVQEAVLSLMEIHEYSEHDVFSVRVAFEEALANALLHGHQGDESRDEFHRLEDNVRDAIAVRRFKLVAHRAIAQQRQPLFRNRRPPNIAAQTFQLLAFVSPGRDPGMQREPSHLAYCFIERRVAGRYPLSG